MMISRLDTPSSNCTSQIPAASSRFAAARCSPVTLVRHSSPRAASPPTAPMMALMAMPRIPSVAGTTTPLMFLMMFPLHWATIRSGIRPRSSRALAEAKATAMGSVQPRAGISSCCKMAVYASYTD